MCALHFWLLCLLAGLFAEKGICLQTPPRIINLEQGDDAYVFDAYANIISINKSSQLTLTCEGDSQVTWTTPITSEDIDQRKNIVQSTMESVLRPHQATLVVDNTVYTDTGKYECVYVAAAGSNPSDQASSTADIFVFVNDPAHVFVQSGIDNRPIPMQQNSESIVPCVPSSREANVTLWRGSGSTLQHLNEKFDPTKGFIIYFPSFHFAGPFQCKGTLGGISETRNLYLVWLAGTSFVPTPTIVGSAKHATRNSDYTMTCSAHAPTDIFLYINWTIPTVSRNRISLGKESSKVIDMGETGNKYREIKRSLTIERVEEGDAGSYTCIVTDHNLISNSKSFFVDVQDETFAYLRFKMDGELALDEPFEFDLGKEEAHFVVRVDAFPLDPPPQLRWYKGDQPLIADSKKYAVQMQKQANILTIYKLDRHDSGVYTLVGNIGDSVQTEMALTVYVNEPPEVRFEGTPSSLYRSGRDFHLVCLAYGCPFANITWEWRQCSAGGNCQREYPPPLTSSGVNEEKVAEFMEFEDACLVKSMLSGKVKEAGYYRCSAESVQGHNSSETPVFITEFSLKFGTNSSDPRPFEQDSLSLFCFGSLFHYAKLTWLWSPSEDRSLLRPVQNQTNVIVVSSSTAYSLTSKITINPVHLSASGYYTCQALSLDNAQVDSKNEAVTVQRLERPMVLETNLNSSTYAVYNEDLFEFVCRVSGKPTPTLLWYRNGTLIRKNESAILLLDHNSRLQIPRIVSGDAGHYVCEAYNRAGSVLLNATLSVFDVQRSSGLSTGGIIGVAVVVIIIFIVAAIFGTCHGRRVCKDRKEKREFEQLQHMLFEKGDLNSYNPDLPMDEQIDALPYDKRWEFPKEQLKFGRTIGQGAFGRVVKAEAIDIVPGQATTTVAVKMLKERADNEQRKALMQELKIMIHIGRHINVVNLLGAITKNIYKGELQVIVEYCHFGNLRHYLLRNRDNFVNQIHPLTGEVDVSVHNIPSRAEFIRDSSRFSGAPNSGMSSEGPSSDGNVNAAMDTGGSLDNPRLSTMKSAPSRPLTTCDLLRYAYQTSNGMTYLSSKKLIHRDLALRNILLADGDTVKICDFGLAKDCYKTSYYRKKTQGPLPVKWMSIESIRDKVFSTESDIWSYGIILWEMFTLGANPYPGMEVDEEFYRKLSSGYRMDKPEFAPKSQYDLMRECWRSDPKSRPSFAAIGERLGAILGASTVQHFSELNDEYVKLGSAFANPHYISMLPTSDSDPASTQLGSPDYVNVDLGGGGDGDLVKVRPQEGVANYINMTGSPPATPATTNGVGNPKVSVYGDRHSRDSELEPMMDDDEDSDNFYRNPPEPVPVVAGGVNPFAASGYLEMGGHPDKAGAVTSSEVIPRKIIK